MGRVTAATKASEHRRHH